MSALDAETIAAWSALITAVGGLTVTAVKGLRNRKKEKKALEEALDAQPEIREQLRLGNEHKAMEGLVYVNEQLTKALKESDERHAAEMVEVRAKLAHCEDRIDAAEAEAEGWQQKYEAEHAIVIMLQEELQHHRREQ